MTSSKSSVHTGRSRPRFPRGALCSANYHGDWSELWMNSTYWYLASLDSILAAAYTIFWILRASRGQGQVHVRVRADMNGSNLGPKFLQKVGTFVVDDADAAQCVVLDVGGARFRVRRDRLCAHSASVRAALCGPAVVSSRVRSQSAASDGSQRTKAAGSGTSDAGYDSETGGESAGEGRKVKGSVHGDDHEGGREQHNECEPTQNYAPGKDAVVEVAVEGVDPADFREMLGAMDDAIAFVLRPPAPHTLACIFRAAHALCCADLISFTTTRLLEAWSSDLHSLRDGSPLASVGDAKEAVALARTFAVPGVLKRAFYELVRVPRDGAVRHALLSDDADGHAPDDCHGRCDDAWPALSAADQRRLHSAHGELQMAWAGLVWTIPNHRAFQCHAQPHPAASHSHSHEDTSHADASGSVGDDLEACAARRDQDRFQTWRDLLEGADLFTPHDPLDGLRRLAELDWAARGFCSACVEARREVFARKREEVWAKLDGWLGL